jgi:hypothetical protein
MEAAMDAKSPTTAAQHRAWNYWFEDGLPTLVGGCGCVLFGLSFLFDHTVFRLVWMALYGVILLRHRPIVEWLKARLTYPRTGYVTPPSSPKDELPPLPDVAELSLEADPVRLLENASEGHERKKRMILVQVMLLAAVLGTMFIDHPWTYAAAGIDLALALWIMNGKDFQLSWIAIGGIPLIGFYLAIFPPASLTPAHRLGYFVTAVGVLIVAEGAVALVQYLWRNPAASVFAE